MLNVIDSFEKLKGFPLAKYEIIKSEHELKNLQFPCWLKASVERHKLELGAVVKANNLQDAQEKLKEMRKKFPTETVIAQEQVEGIEMILGLKEDKVFGKLLLIGFGGTFTEVVKDISFRALPVNKKEIEKQISELKMYPALVSRKKYALDKLIKLADKLASSDFKEADLNPVIVTEQGAFVVDARIQI